MSIRRDTLSVLRSIRPDVLGALLVATIGVDLLDLAAPPNDDIGVSDVIAVIIRVVIVFSASYAVQRQLAGGAQPFRPTIAMARFAVLQLLLLAGYGLATKLGVIFQGTGEVPLATQWLFGFLALAFYALFTIRLLAWNAALAMGEPFSTLSEIWRRQAGHLGAIGGAYIALILPVTAIHLAMTLVSLRIVMTANLRLALALVDGLFQALELGLACALGVVAWRIATAIEAGPPPR
ncbi:hypothetical protein [Sphingomonas sp. MMS24-J13]|uniref:hypothetical protein n=1 Tax=Sphingomonas sp. MMS24-J13 TaxID=3238686 RepID=UPI00384E6538